MRIKNIASAAVMNTVITDDQKVVKLQGTMYLFGRLLYISTLERIDIEKVFQYPLTPIPLGLALVNGNINKTD